MVAAELPVAIGNTWAIGVDDEITASSIAQGLGGSSVHAGDYCAATG